MNQPQNHPFRIPFEDKFSDRNYLRKTWTGRLVIANGIMFVILTLSGNSIFKSILHPGTETLINFGAKEAVALAHGEWWRLICPIFLHIGIIHFLLNNAALRIVGRIIENYVGSFWFLLIYFISGIFGNLCSALSNTAIGAGASGAIFGLIGVGVIVEWVYEFQSRQTQAEVLVQGNIIEVETVDKPTRKFKFIPGPFTFMALLNIGLAISLNFIFSLSDSIGIGIDNAAHLGGLASGMILGLASLFSVPNKLLAPRKVISGGLVLMSSIVCLSVATGMTKTNMIRDLYLADASSQEPVIRFWRYSRWLDFDQINPQFRFLRGELLIKNGEYDAAMEDFQFPLALPEFEVKFDELIQELYQQGNQQGAITLKKKLMESPPNRL
ncbi:MAG: rhomboid family intramembrane serine protease [Oligoflexales bacterium]